MTQYKRETHYRECDGKGFYQCSNGYESGTESIRMRVDRGPVLSGEGPAASGDAVIRCR